MGSLLTDEAVPVAPPVLPDVMLDGRIWDGYAGLTVALTIKRFMAANPAPDDSRYAADLAAWAENLESHALARLGHSAPAGRPRHLRRVS